MPRHQSRKRSRSRTSSKTRRKSQRGGELAGNPPSGWGWTLGTAGNGWTQFMNSMTLQPGQNASTAQSTQLVIKGGRKRKSRGKRGGSWGAIASQAAAPLSLVAMNHLYGKSRKRR